MTADGRGTGVASPATLDGALAVCPMADRSRAAHELRRRLHRWAEPAPVALAGQFAVVSMGTSSLGLAAAAALSRCGAHVLLADRPGRALDDAARTVAAATHNPSVSPVALDPSAGRAALADDAERLLAAHPALDVLLLPAGPPADGAPAAALPFALTARLQPAMVPGTRVIWVAAGAPPGDVGELARGWAKLLAPRGVAVHAVDPGHTDTWPDGPARGRPWPLRPPPRSFGQAVDTAVWLATAPEAGRAGGGLWLDRQRRPLRRGRFDVARPRARPSMLALARHTGTTDLLSAAQRSAAPGQAPVS